MFKRLMAFLRWLLTGKSFLEPPTVNVVLPAMAPPVIQVIRPANLAIRDLIVLTAVSQVVSGLTTGGAHNLVPNIQNAAKMYRRVLDALAEVEKSEAEAEKNADVAR